MGKSSGTSALAEKYLGISFCLFYGTTGSVPLTQKIYGGDADMVEWRWEQCKVTEQKGEAHDME